MIALDIETRHELVTLVEREGAQPVADAIGCSHMTLGRILVGEKCLDATQRQIKRLIARRQRAETEAGSP